MNREQIKHMVDRFLGWKLPRDAFVPDCGISFDMKHPTRYEPSGTNLFDAQQATEMVQHMVEGMPVHGSDEIRVADRSPRPTLSCCPEDRFAPRLHVDAGSHSCAAIRIARASRPDHDGAARS